jgi:phage shock protein A
MAESFGTKLKRAFLWHWHLLALGAGVTLALLSGKPDLALPVVAAGELAYLGFLGANQRFQNVLRGKELLDQQENANRASQAKLRELLDFLAPEDAERFARLRTRCVEFSKLRDRLSATRGAPPASGLRNTSLEKMLWLFLRLLHHKSGLDQFRDSTDEDLLKEQLESAETEIAQAKSGKRSERLIHSLEEKRDAIRERLANYRAAEDSRDLLLAELGKTEQKIEHINEVGMMNRASDDLSAQIDGIAESMASSERALGDLRSGLVFDEEQTPALLTGESTTTSGPPPIPLSE